MLKLQLLTIGGADINVKGLYLYSVTLLSFLSFSGKMSLPYNLKLIYEKSNYLKSTGYYISFNSIKNKAVNVS